MVGNGDLHTQDFLDEGDILLHVPGESPGGIFIGTGQAVSRDPFLVEFDNHGFRERNSACPRRGAFRNSLCWTENSDSWTMPVHLHFVRGTASISHRRGENGVCDRSMPAASLDNLRRGSQSDIRSTRPSNPTTLICHDVGINQFAALIFSSGLLCEHILKYQKTSGIILGDPPQQRIARCLSASVLWANAIGYGPGQDNAETSRQLRLSGVEPADSQRVQ